MNRKQVADHVGVAESTITKVENASSVAKPGDVALMLDLYGIVGEQREFLLTLSREARQRGWWHVYRGVIPPGFEVFVGLESEAAKLLRYDVELIPGLLQTGAYYEAYLSRARRGGDPEVIEAKVRFRLARQERLADPDGLQLWSIMNEACLRRSVGGRAVMKEQLRHLREAAEKPNITIQVLPFAAGAHPAMDGGFVIVEFPERADSNVVYIEGQTDSLYLEDADAVETYDGVFNLLRAMASSPEESLGMIAEAERNI
jgi:hypothetical protein